MNRQHSMARLVREYIDHRRQLGFELASAQRLLRNFARYADRQQYRGPLTADLAIRWVLLPPNSSPNYLAGRLSIIRGFARFRAIYDPRTEIPPTHALGAGIRRKAPYILTPAETAAILRAARQLPPAGSLRPHTYATMFGLLACTGLRHREVLRLDRLDVDWKRQLLHVRMTKFRKSRIVPLHHSTIEALAQYARLRDQRYPVPRTDAFFVSMRGARLAEPTVRATFILLRKGLTWSGCSARGYPRIHDFRHTFACRRLLQWYHDGADLHRVVPSLSTYLGHADVQDTYWYVTGIPELLDIAGSRFEHFASLERGGLL